MKIKNIFKKDRTEVKASMIQKMDKKQLEKMVGGTGEATADFSAVNVVEKATSGLKDTLKTQV